MTAVRRPDFSATPTPRSATRTEVGDDVLEEPADAVGCEEGVGGDHGAFGAGAWVFDSDAEGGGDGGDDDDGEREEGEECDGVGEEVAEPLDEGEEAGNKGGFGLGLG